MGHSLNAGSRRFGAFSGLACRLVVLIVILAGLTNCQAVDLTAKCPSAPPVVPDFGPKANYDGKASMTLELSRRYLATRLASITRPTPSDSSGLNIKQVSLSESDQKTGEGAQLILAVRPWIRSQGGEVNEFSDLNYTLRLDVVPFLITPAAFGDPGQRQALVSGNQGLILRFDFAELFADSVGRKAAWRVDSSVQCAADLNFIEGRLLSGIFEKFTVNPPTVALSADPLSSVVEKLSGQSPNLVALSAGTNSNGMKLGFVFDVGTPDPFDSDNLTIFQDFNSSEVDWGIDIDTEYVASTIDREVRQAMLNSHSAARYDGSVINFNRDGIEVQATGTIRICGDFRVRAKTIVTPRIRHNSEGLSVLQAPASQPETSKDWTSLQALCAGIDALGRFIGDLFAKPLGKHSLVVVSGCRDVLGEPIEITPAAGERFYATTISTNGLFLIGGRSSAVDATTPERAGVQAC